MFTWQLPVSNRRKNEKACFHKEGYNLYTLRYFILNFQRMNNSALKNYKIPENKILHERSYLNVYFLLTATVTFKRTFTSFLNIFYQELRILSRRLLNNTKLSHSFMTSTKKWKNWTPPSLYPQPSIYGLIVPPPLNTV